MSSTGEKSISNINMSDTPTLKIFKKKGLREFKLRGKKYTYSTPKQLEDLAVKFSTTKKVITQLVKGNTKRVFYNKNTKTTQNVDISKPLMLKNFTTKKLTTKQLLSGGNSGISVFEKVPANLNRQVAITYTFIIKISKDTKSPQSNTFTAIINKNTNLEQLCREDVLKLYAGVGNIENITITDIKVYENQEGGPQLALSNMKLKLEKPPVLKMFDNIDYRERKHCVRDLMYEYYGKRYTSKNFQNMDTIEDVRKWCEAKNIKLLAYDILGNTVASNYPDKKNKNKTLLALVYHNHLYPLKSKYLSKVKPLTFDDNEIVLERNDFDSELLNIIQSGNVPANIFMKSDEIIKFDYENNIYICNPNFNDCKKILKQFGLYDKITPSISFTSTAIRIQDLYLKENIDSFFPQSNRFLKGGYNYFTEDDALLEEQNIITIDANKFYPSCLKELEYLAKVDFLDNDLEDNNILEPDFMYLVKPEQHSILLPNTNIYLGEHLEFCKTEGLCFEILEKVKITKFKNYYTDMIKELQKKVSPLEFKKLMNCLIGCFELEGKTEHTQFLKFVNEDEKNRSNGYFKKYADDLYINFSTKEKIRTHSKKLIAVQVKDLSRRKLYLKMRQLKINESNLIKIKTDSITYIGTDKPKLGKALGMWKEEEVNLEKFEMNYFNTEHESIIPFCLNNNVLNNSYAGAGKTYDIINNVIPNLKKSYLILTPSHSSLKEYNKLKLNCNVIQKYTYNDIEIEEDIIIIDEIGMCDYAAMKNLYKWSMLGKKIIAYGDFKQLLPVGRLTSLNTQLYTECVFAVQNTIDTNYRNDFTREFYDECINGNVDKEELRSKYLNDSNSDNVCCYTNEGCDKYNKIVSERLGFSSMFKVGAKLICNTNKLRKYDIYNKFTFIVEKVEGDMITLDNGVSLHKDEFMKKEGDKTFISFGYARTLHSYQGESVKNLFYPKEEIKYCNNRMFYTLISRLKT